MKKLLEQLKPYRKESILAPLFKLLEAGLELLIPLIVAAVIDRGVAQGQTGYIVRMGLLMAGLGLAGLCASVTAQYFAAKAAVCSVSQLRRALFAHLQCLSYAQLDTLGVPTMLTRLTSDMNQVQSGVNLTLRLLLRSPFVVFGAMLMAFTIDTHAALVFVCVIPLLGVVVTAIMLVTIPLYRRVQSRLDRVLSKTRENLTGVRVLRAFGAEDSEKAAFDARTQELMQGQTHVGRISALLNPLTYVIVNLGIVALLRTGALQVDSGTLSQGDVIALYNYMSQILVELIKLANLILNITKSVACANRIQSVMELPAADTGAAELPALDTAAPAVQFENVALRYAGAGEDALHGVSFTALRGQTIGIIGGTGSGKTSLVNLIPRFYDASQGRVSVFGADVHDWPLDALRRQIGVVPQKALLFRGTILENLLWGDESAPLDAVADALVTAQAMEIVESRENGLEAEIEQGGRNLSGGQRQRLSIARALVRKPQILILDDSASALDYATDAALRRALRELPERPTVFIVSQRTASIRHADCILVLEDGVIVGQGTHAQLLESCPVYREIHDSQYQKEGVQ